MDKRLAADRVGARCHAFGGLTVAFARAGRRPARARWVRCPLAAWLVRGKLGRRLLNATAARRPLVDVQLDATWRKSPSIRRSFDHLPVDDLRSGSR